MVRMLSIAAAAATLFVAVPAVAQAPAYRAIPATPATALQNVVVGETLWKCAPEGCTTTKSASRPAILCAQAVKKLGRLDSFVVNGTAVGTDDLAKCNAKAKDGATALARN